MPINDYRGNDNRIVRIKNESVDDMISYLAELNDIPYQAVFECYIEVAKNLYPLNDVEAMEKIVSVSKWFSDSE